MVWGVGIFSGQLLLGALASWPLVSNAVLSGACFALPQVFFLRWRRLANERGPQALIREALRERAPEPLSRPTRGTTVC